MAQEPITVTQAVARRLRVLRDGLGLTHGQLAARAATRGAPQITAYLISAIERGGGTGRRVVGLDEVVALAHVLDVSPMDLIDAGAPIRATDTLTVEATSVRRWFCGEQSPRRGRKSA